MKAKKQKKENMQKWDKPRKTENRIEAKEEKMKNKDAATNENEGKETNKRRREM